LITARNIINRQIPVLDPKDDPVDALNLMDQFRVADLPVVDGTTYVGMISETALMTLDGPGEEDVPTYHGLLTTSVRPDDHILDVLKTSSENHLSVIPVVGEDGRYHGAITLEDLVESMTRLQGAGQPGGIIVLEMPAKDYSLQQVARIVEENNAKILSTSVQETESGLIEVNLKINQPDLNAILQSFNRFNYTVKGSYQEPEYTEGMQKRYEELMRFLNI
jgi:acetoin utilization protein AcuB